MKMLSWPDVLEFALSGSPEPSRTVEKSEIEWQGQLTAEQYLVLRQGATEVPSASEGSAAFEEGVYGCVGCGALLFNGRERFASGTGWPSFSQPIEGNAISYAMDDSHGMSRVEVRCNCCRGHLGHVFPDGPAPSGLRFCLNEVALNKRESIRMNATFGGGCFWCTEAMFQQLRGVEAVVSGYSGGSSPDPTYEQVCRGATGHAEVVELSYDPAQISFEELLKVHLGSHDPTTLNRQGADIGTQYRSVIFYRNEDERLTAERVLAEFAEQTGLQVVTEVASFEHFYPAEELHQNYYRLNSRAGYCEAVIEPKLAKFRASYRHLFREES